MTSNTNKFTIYALLTLTLFFIAALTVSKLLVRPEAVHSGINIIMGTNVRITAIAKNRAIAEKSIAAALQTMADIESQMSYYDANSKLSELNNYGHSRDVYVGQELFYVINRALEFNTLTDGAFDCTIAPILELWRESAKRGKKPTDAELAEAKSKVGSDKIIIDKSNHTVRFAKEGVRIDLGGIAKGYAVDKAVETMQNAGAIGGLVDAGGDIRCFGKPIRVESWIIGLRNPNLGDDNAKTMRKFSINDTALTTSGDYERYVVIDEQKYSHIISPADNRPAAGMKSVSIIAEDAITADALSTAVTVLGIEKGIKLIESLDLVEALIITGSPEQHIIKTSGMKRYLAD